MNVAAKPDQRGTQLRALDMAGCVFQLMQAQGCQWWVWLLPGCWLASNQTHQILTQPDPADRGKPQASVHLHDQIPAHHL